MTGKGDAPSTTTNGLQYPMVDLFSGGMVMPLMFYECSGDLLPLIAQCTADIHAGMDKSA